MNKLKDWLMNALGGFGCLIYFLVAYLFQFAPLIVLDLHFIIFFIVFFVICFIPIIGTIVNVVIWIWALVVTINGSQDVFAIIYYIIFGINALHVVSKLLLAFLPNSSRS